MKKQTVEIPFVVLMFCACVAALAQAPVLLGTSVSGTNLVICGSNGVSGGNYYVLTTTNLALPLNQWPAVAISVLPASTNFTNTITNTITNAVGSGCCQCFYALQQDTPITSGDGMALIPAGSFTMGDTLGDSLDGLIYDVEYPTNVYVSAFYMDVFDVTESLWANIYDWALANGYDFYNTGAAFPKGTNYPVQWVDWYDTVKWCNARSQQADLTPVYYTDAGLTQVYTNGDYGTTVYQNLTVNGYRLPTEAEWEKAARGGLSGQRFPWGDSISESQANYCGWPVGTAGGSCYSYDLGPSGYNAAFDTNWAYPWTDPCTSPVGYFAPNGYGLYDMAGSVFEWCWDWYGVSYGQPTTTNPTGPEAGTFRVLRGSCWDGSAYAARCAARSIYDPYNKSTDIGFRCVRGL